MSMGNKVLLLAVLASIGGLSSAIINGTKPTGKIGSLVSVWYNALPVATGAAISTNWAVTVAGPVSGIDKSQLYVISDLIDLLDTTSVSHAVNTIIVHPSYKPGAPSDYDVALLKVTEPFRTAMTVANSAPLNSLAEVGGWGTTSVASEAVSETLHIIKVKMLTNTLCTSTFFQQSINIALTGRMVCSQGDVNQSPCTGDLGAPLADLTSTTQKVYGLASWFPVCGMHEFPAIYTRLFDSTIRQWITTNAGV